MVLVNIEFYDLEKFFHFPCFYQSICSPIKFCNLEWLKRRNRNVEEPAYPAFVIVEHVNLDSKSLSEDQGLRTQFWSVRFGLLAEAFNGVVWYLSKVSNTLAYDTWWVTTKK